ncbi:MAG: hypothetical protein NVSMB19_10950 [Vulcanimicrobiaceae bacterium]
MRADKRPNVGTGENFANDALIDTHGCTPLVRDGSRWDRPPPVQEEALINGKNAPSYAKRMFPRGKTSRYWEGAMSA